MYAQTRRTVLYPEPLVSLGPVFLVILGLVGAGCSALGPEMVADQSAATEQMLLSDGVHDQVVSCVLDLAEDDLERGRVDDLMIDELVGHCRRARAAMEPEVEQSLIPDVELALRDIDWTFGDNPELDRLWTACEEGDGNACDQLFEQSPLGSDYEDFGVSCGNRPDILDCAELADLE